jgi:hypothetical protein
MNESPISARSRYWSTHPLITESAILPTPSVQEAVKRVLSLSRKGRASVAFWADPLTGKSSCITAIHAAALAKVPGCGVLVLEAVEDDQPAEGRLLAQILKAAGFLHRIDPSIAGKRDQVHRALLALAGDPGHLFLLIDEAQELKPSELGWLKAVINGLVRQGIKVTTALFGQKELKKARDDLYKDGRSDLGVRFMKNIHEFRKIQRADDLQRICEAIDSKSEYPPGSSWTYTQLLFPAAFVGGFRFTNVVPDLWSSISDFAPPDELIGGINMEVVSSILAHFCILAKDLDGPSMSVPPELIGRAVKKGFSS